jgi:hypothetical protein
MALTCWPATSALNLVVDRGVADDLPFLAPVIGHNVAGAELVGEDACWLGHELTTAVGRSAQIVAGAATDTSTVVTNRRISARSTVAALTGSVLTVGRATTMNIRTPDTPVATSSR